MIDYNSVILLSIAMVNALTAYIAFKTKNIAADTREIAKKTEVQTNGMRIDLIQAVTKTAKDEGKQEGKIEGKIEVLKELKNDAKINK